MAKKINEEKPPGSFGEKAGDDLANLNSGNGDNSPKETPPRKPVKVLAALRVPKPGETFRNKQHPKIIYHVTEVEPGVPFGTGTEPRVWFTAGGHRHGWKLSQFLDETELIEPGE